MSGFWQSVNDAIADMTAQQGGGAVLYPVPAPPTGVVVVTGEQTTTAPTGPGASACCDRCSLRGKAGPGAGSSTGGVVAVVPAGGAAGPLSKGAPLPWWVYVLVGFAVGRLFRG